ncbi:homoserine O-acetyltransferase (plasmid) [Gemmatirosa kalamazoonensis]|uniref:Homoserine O-acetyltransferase n=1 Tax=Gemmatirosa kalamazoonensis TaxID=861299 RepID=W0RPR1_9BACT|nr:homoserine O-succinyltransferase [Gemmatirosa kalamazoonensis]AHG92482.1 homoserine O-acetyltransferase [Gemmatirosa kalamazoonensis]
MLTVERATGVPNYELVGPAGAPVVVALGGISANAHAGATAADPAPGWWDPVVGRGRALDTTRLRVLGIDWLDGGRGDDGRPARIVTTYDQADALVAALDAVEVERVHAVIGASYGGMVALAFAERYPERVERLVVVSAPHEAHPLSTALRTVQRRVVELGIETGRAHDALALARALAMTTYRGAREFAERFDSRPDTIDGADATFPVERYILHHGRKFAAAWRPERFLALSLSADLHRVDPAAVRVPTTLVAAEGDAIVPREQMAELSMLLGAPNTLVDLASRNGHDAFLTEPAAIGRILATALCTRSFA